MTTVQDLHDRAMALADDMLAARERGEFERAREIAAAAFVEELGAATRAFDRGVSVATRLILFRSAANLAREAREWQAGLDLAARALATDDLKPYRAEVLGIMDTLRTYEHLRAQGIVLSDTDIQLSVAGPDVAPGFAPSHEIMRRVEQVRLLAVRQYMYQSGIPFEASTPRAARFRAAFTPYLSLPRTASYAVTVRFGVDEQGELDLPVDAHGIERPRPAVALVLRDVFASVEAYAAGGLDGVRHVIVDDQYARNAAALLRELSPDDEGIHTVGLTISREGQSAPIHLPSRRHFDGQDRTGPHFPDALPPKFETFVGQLREGNTISSVPHASIVLDSSKSKRFLYDEAEHTDIIAAYWKQTVRVKLRRQGTRYYLVSIDDASGKRSRR